MLITKEVEVVLSSNTVKYYEDLGYQIPRHKGNTGKMVVPLHAKIIVKVEDLPKRSEARVEVLCDYCLDEGKETIMNRSGNRRFPY